MEEDRQHKNMSHMARTIISVLFAVFLLQQLIVYGAQPEKKKYADVALIIFGDSFVDTGNNNYINTTSNDKADFWPYGETYFNFPTGRFSDGRLIPDFIAEYVNLPLIPPFLQPGSIDPHNFFGVNFAGDGAGVLVQTFQGYVINLKTQVRYYKQMEKRLRSKLGYKETKMAISEAVYLFSIGSNDYTMPFLINSTAVLSSGFIDMVIGNLTEVIKEIYNTGARKFTFINLPPLGCLPAMRILRPENNGRCLEEASWLTSAHNKALSKLLFQMQMHLDGFKYSLFDFENGIQQRIDHPSKFGFKEAKMACCGTGKLRGIYSCGGKRPVKEFELCENPNEYVFWDSYHLTEMAYKQLAYEIWGNVKSFFNVNLKQSFQVKTFSG